MSIYGLTKVYDSQDAKVDIVFLHGLRGDAQKTWTKNTVLWPKDLLPKEIPETRVFLFGYDSGIVHRDPSHVTNTEIQSDAADVCAKLHAERSSTGTADRPIIFIAHSLGGLVASQVLVLGDQKDDSSSVKAVTQNLRGLIFLGTPFQGSPAASLGENVRKVLKLISVSTQQHTLELLTTDSQRLRQLVRSFADILNKRRMSQEEEERIEAFFCYETLKTSAYGIPLMQIVEPDSAQIPGCGDAAPIRADHVNICKFGATTDEGYGIIIARIRKIMAPAVSKPAGSGRNLYNYGKIGNQAMGDQNIYGQTLNL